MRHKGSTPGKAHDNHDEDNDREESTRMAEEIVLVVNGTPHRVQAEAEIPEVSTVAGER